jgi:hypothetical protein
LSRPGGTPGPLPNSFPIDESTHFPRLALTDE